MGRVSLDVSGSSLRLKYMVTIVGLGCDCSCCNAMMSWLSYLLFTGGFMSSMYIFFVNNKTVNASLP